MSDYLAEAKNAMDKSTNYENQARPDSMVAQAHFATAAALIAIAERLDKLIDRIDGFTDVDGGCIDVTVLR